MTVNKPSLSPTITVPPIAEISPELRARVAAIISGAETSSLVDVPRDQLLAVVNYLLSQAAIEPTMFWLEPEEPEITEVEFPDVEGEISPDLLRLCLERLKADFERGIVLIDDEMDEAGFVYALEQEPNAGIKWEAVELRLLANQGALLKKAATMQGGGELIGIYPNGELLIKTRGTEPVIFGHDGAGQLVKITTGTPKREEALEKIQGEGLLANYYTIRQSILDDGFFLPQDSPDNSKRGVVAAVEAVTRKPFVGSQSDREWRYAILDCGPNLTRYAKAVVSNPDLQAAHINTFEPRSTSQHRGAIYFLKG